LKRVPVFLVGVASAACISSSRTEVRLRATDGVAAEAIPLGEPAHAIAARAESDGSLSFDCDRRPRSPSPAEPRGDAPSACERLRVMPADDLIVDHPAPDVLAWEGATLRVRGVALGEDGTRFDLTVPVANVSEVRDVRSVNRGTGARTLVAGLLFTVAGGLLLFGGASVDPSAAKLALYGSGGLVGSVGLALDAMGVLHFVTPTWDRVVYPEPPSGFTPTR
jgi:hypothetical protein